MSVKPIAASPDELKSLKFKDFKGKFYKFLKKLAIKHTSQATAAPFFMDLQQNYVDGATEVFFAAGKMQKWKLYAKQNATKLEEALRGFCYVTLDEQSQIYTLNLMPIAGKLKTKEKKIQMGMRAAVPLSKVTVAVVAGEFVDNDALEAAVEAMAEAPDEVEAEDDEQPVVSHSAANSEHAPAAAGLSPKQEALAQKAASELAKLSSEIDAIADAKAFSELTEKKFKPLYGAWAQLNTVSKRPADETKLVEDVKESLQQAGKGLQLKNLEAKIGEYEKIAKKEDLEGKQTEIEAIFKKLSPETTF